MSYEPLATWGERPHRLVAIQVCAARESLFTHQRAVARNISSVSASIPEDEEQPDAESEMATEESMATSAENHSRPRHWTHAQHSQFVLEQRGFEIKFSFHNGNVYTGEFGDGLFEGFGRYNFEGGYYDGDWKEGRYDGSGELLYATGGKYTGEFRNSVARGFGMEVLPNGTKRRGVWVDGKPTE
jgi:hypothetical protein